MTAVTESPTEQADTDVKADDQTFSIADYFRKAVKVPRDTITLYTDGEAAWEYEKANDRQAEIVKEMGNINTRVSALASQARPQSPRSIAEDTPAPGQGISDELTALEAEHELLQKQKADTISRLKASGVTFGLRALFPSELEMVDPKARRLANAKFKEGETPTEDVLTETRETIGTALVLEGMVEYIVYPGNKRVNGPFEYTEFMAMKGSLDQAEYGRLITLANVLNTRQAFKDAQADAGFHS